MRIIIAILFVLFLIFVAYADDCPDGTYMLDPDISIIQNGYNLINMTWDATASYGNISGVAVLNSTAGGSYGATNYTDFPSDTSGVYCWCKMIIPTTSAWVFLDSVSSYPESTWILMCVRGCSDNFTAFRKYRNIFFSSVENKCITCSTGNYCSNGISTACTNKPTNSTYIGAGTNNDCPWQCDSGYTQYDSACHGACLSHPTLHAGQYSFPLFRDKTNVSSPVIHIRTETNEVCYVYMESDTINNQPGLKVRWNNAVYHAIDPRQ